MSKIYDLYCTKHGRIHIEVEKPPIKFSAAPHCPFCAEILKQQNKDVEKKWQHGFACEGEGALA